MIASFENSIRILNDYKIPREFFGYDPVNKPNFNLPNKISIQGFKNHFATMKTTPTVKIMFNSLKTDIYKEHNCFSDNKISEAKQKDPGLYEFYLKKTKVRLMSSVKPLVKQTVKRKTKEAQKEALAVKEARMKARADQEHLEDYRRYWDTRLDI